MKEEVLPRVSGRDGEETAEKVYNIGGVCKLHLYVYKKQQHDRFDNDSIISYRFLLKEEDHEIGEELTLTDTVAKRLIKALSVEVR